MVNKRKLRESESRTEEFMRWQEKKLKRFMKLKNDFHLLNLKRRYFCILKDTYL